MKAVRAQLELMEQDCCRVSAPDYTTRFSSLEDAVDRLLPFHVRGPPAAVGAQNEKRRQQSDQHGQASERAGRP